MFKKLFVSFAIFASFSGALFASGSHGGSYYDRPGMGPADYCNVPGNHKDTWNVSLNNNDWSSKEDLLQSLKLISTGGFKTNYLHVYDDTIHLSLVFDETYYIDFPRRQEVRRKVVNGLSKIAGNRVDCSRIVIYYPSGN